MLDKFIGSLIGGAAGDALGYAIEFDNEKAIEKKYGKSGITEYELHHTGVAQFSDDTQMTLFTANGLITGYTQNRLANGNDDKNGFMSYISQAYQDWHTTQFNLLPSHTPKCAWIGNIPALYEMRAPGGTCLKSCYIGANGTIDDPINDQYGCGGVMRVAPIGLMFSVNDGYTIEKIDMIGAATAALTHGNPLGYMPAAILVHVINRMVYTDMSLLDAVLESIEFVKKLFVNSSEKTNFINLIHKSIELANSSLTDLSCIHILGEGWTGDEALAISIFCALRHQDDFEKAIIAAVNHRGDSDSTGAITGNILGARMGIHGIPQKFIDNLELKDLIVEIATDLYKCTRMSTEDMIADDVWHKKYIDKTFA